MSVLLSRRSAARLLICAAIVLGGAAGARAADPVFPPGSKIGLVPPPGMTPSSSFQGFLDQQRNAGILIVELPAPAFADIEKNLTPESLTAQGVAVETRENFPVKDGQGFLVVGRQDAGGASIRKWLLVATNKSLTALVTFQVPDAAKDAYPDAAIKAALGTLAFRATVPTEELLSVLPFTIKDLAGFRIVRVMQGGAALLTEGEKDSIELGEQPLFLATIAQGAPPEAERDTFARRALASTPGIKDVRFTRSEPQRIGGHPGYETLVEAKDAKDNTDLAVIQWLRFGTNAHLRMVGIARKDAWDKLYPRFRTLRDGIELR